MRLSPREMDMIRETLKSSLTLSTARLTEPGKASTEFFLSGPGLLGAVFAFLPLFLAQKAAESLDDIVGSDAEATDDKD